MRPGPGSGGAGIVGRRHVLTTLTAWA